MRYRGLHHQCRVSLRTRRTDSLPGKLTAPLTRTLTSKSARSFFFSSRRRHTRSVSAFLLNRSSDLQCFLRVRAGNTDVLTDAEENVRQKLRSEERRVGKECISEWWQEHQYIKTIVEKYLMPYSFQS